MTGDEVTCREVLELLTEYLEGALAPLVQATVDDHLRECEGCERYLAQLHATIALAGSLRDEDVPEEVRQSLMDAFRSWRAAATGDPGPNL